VTSSRPPKAALLVAQRVVRDVVRNGTRPGDLLPPERVMLETYEIGRGTLREALRLLEFQGVIALKPGPGGGPILLNPAASHLASTLQLLMQLNHATYRTIVEVRTAMEPMTSQLAAARISDKSLEELRLTVENMRDSLEDRDVFLESNKRFHDIIAWSSGNVLFSYIVDSLVDILDGTVIGIDYPRHRRVAILKAHEEIFAALAQHDPQASLERMRLHIDAYATYAQRKFPDVLDQIITWDRQPGF
jgi:GntR family transcriptional regulator, transcriptional repressor for pyruvate dehydrogenase complex